MKERVYIVYRGNSLLAVFAYEDDARDYVTQAFSLGERGLHVATMIFNRGQVKYPYAS